MAHPRPQSDILAALSRFASALRSKARPRGQHGEGSGVQGRVLAILRNGTLGRELVIPSRNIITDAGDIYYAQRAAAETPTNTFNRMSLATGVNAPGISKSASYTILKDSGGANNVITGSELGFDAGYPKSNDDDPDNTDAAPNAVSYSVYYAQAAFASAGISHVGIHPTSPANGTPLLMVAAFAAAFEKTASDTLTVFVTHTFLGV